MKRKTPPLSVNFRSGDLLDSFTRDQLAWIGAVAMAYNEAETALHRAFSACITYAVSLYQISSRIGGTDGIVHVIKHGLPLSLPKATAEMIDRTLVGEGFSQLKTYRDAVVHARLIDAESGVATVPMRKGDHQFVLVSEDALKGLYLRLTDVKEEMEAVAKIIAAFRRLEPIDARDDQGRAKLEGRVRDATALCQSHQKHRRSLKPLPKFPDERDIAFPKRPAKEARLPHPEK